MLEGAMQPVPLSLCAGRQGLMHMMWHKKYIALMLLCAPLAGGMILYVAQTMASVV